MKTLILIIAAVTLAKFSSVAQKTTGELEGTIARLDNAKSLSDYHSAAYKFRRIAELNKTDWLPWYYAAFCNVRIGALCEGDEDQSEPAIARAEEEIQWALALLDTANQKKELSEIYCVLSMLSRVIVYINPVTYRTEYSPKASKYMRLAVNANPENPRALYLDAWEKFAIPIKLGGDKAKAKELLIAAKQKLDHNNSFGMGPHWGKAEVEAILKQLE